MGYRFQFITLAGWHALNLSMFELASAYHADGMLGYSQLPSMPNSRASCSPITVRLRSIGRPSSTPRP